MNESGAVLVARAIRRAGAPGVFGLPGTQTVELFESLRRERLRTVLATSETSAAFMAAGWARMTGRPAVLVTIPGPGFTWALSGIAEAKLDSVPLVHITLRARSGHPRGFALQDIDQPAVAAPLAKQVLEVAATADIENAITRAFRLAQSGEPGPVLVELTPEALGDVAQASVPADHWEDAEPPAAAIEQLIEALNSAKRPLLLVGQGTAGCTADLARLVDALGAPVLTTPSARGVVPESHLCSLGFDPLAGSLPSLNRFLATCDLVVVLGAKLGHNGTAGFGLELPANLIQVDADPGNIGATYPVALGIAADAGAVLRALAGRVRSSSWAPDELSGVRAELAASSEQLEPRLDPAVFAFLNRQLAGDGVVVLDSGQHQIMARRHLRVSRSRSLLFPSDFQSMGFAIPTAIGAALAAPDRMVNVVVGDGGFAMNGLELLSAVREGVRLTVFVFVDGYLGQIRQQQLANHGVEFAVKLQNPDFQELASAMGLGYRLAGEMDLSDLEHAGGVTLIEVPVTDGSGLGWTAAKARVKNAARTYAPSGFLRLWGRLRGWKDRID